MASKKRKSKKTAKVKPSTRRKSSRRKKPNRRGGKGPGSQASIHQGVALGKAGQSGDVQALSSVEDVDSESVEELVEEGLSVARVAERVPGERHGKKGDEEARVEPTPQAEA